MFTKSPLFARIRAPNATYKLMSGASPLSPTLKIGNVVQWENTSFARRKQGFKSLHFHTWAAGVNKVLAFCLLLRFRGLAQNEQTKANANACEAFD